MAVKKKELFNPMESWKATLESRQFELEEGTQVIYEEQPVDILTFVTSKDFLGIQPQYNTKTGEKAPQPLSEAQLEFLESATDFDNNVNDYILWVGKGGGKNFVATVVFSYLSYKLLCMRNPHSHFGRDGIKPMTMINVGANSLQGQKNFFEPLCEMFRRPGFAAWLEKKGFDAATGIKKNEIELPKRINLYSGHTNSSGIEGFDIIASLVDECDSKEFGNAANIYRTLATSASTRFGSSRKNMTISFRRYVGSSGVLKQLYAEFKEREERTGTAFARRFATWEFNNRPGMKESLQEYIDSKPEEAACMVESKDDEGYFDSWIKDTQRIKNAMDREKTWIFDFPVPLDNWAASKDSEYSWLDVNGEKQYLDPFDFPIKSRGVKGVKYMFAADPGLGNVQTGGDAYGVTLAHRELVKITDRNGKVQTYAKPVIDFTFRFTGRMFKEGEIQMVAVQKLIKKLNDYGYKIGVYSFDGWNSANTTQWIARTYPGAVLMPRNLVELRDFTAFKDAIFSEVPPTGGLGEKEIGGGISMFWHPVLFDELKELRIDRTRTIPRVDHTESSFKDISDSIAKCVRVITLAWPYADTFVVGGGLIEKHPEAKVKEGRFQAVSNPVSYSDAVGLGRFKK